MLKRRVRNKTAIPPILAVNFDRRQPRWQRTRCHDVPRINAFVRRVEIMEITALNLDRADGKPHRPIVEQIPIDQFIQRVCQRR